MSKQSSELIESTIELSKQKTVDNSGIPKVFERPFIAVNAMILASAPVFQKSVLDYHSENIIVEQGNVAETIFYPIVQLRYENGKTFDIDKDENNCYKITSLDENQITKATVDVVYQQTIGTLRKENAILKELLSKSFPVHTVVYLVINGMVMSGASLLLILRDLYNIYVMDLYYIMCALLISLTLFATALVSTKDWKDFINGK